jgi:tetratricopeptide (TPR) repeat protein
MKFVNIRVLYLCLTLLAANSLLQAQEPAVDQAAFSDLKERASALASAGRLKEAIPILEELVSRIQRTGSTDIPLDFAYFLLGTGHIQLYADTGDTSQLNTTIQWYDRLEKEYPDSRNLKQVLLKKIDVLRALKQTSQAIQLMQDILNGQKNITFTVSEEIKLLKDICQIYYGQGKLKEGLPFFKRLSSEGRTIEEKALGAAATFEGLIADNQLDEAIALLPVLAKESPVRYLPRLNVALLKASDTMVDKARYTDAALVLNLIKTTDMMIRYNEDVKKEKQSVMNRLEILGRSNDRIDELKQEINNIDGRLKVLRDLPRLRNDLLVRRARNFVKTNRPFESFWMFYDLYEENPDHERAEFYLYASFSGARRIKKHQTVLDLGYAYREKHPEGDYYSDVTSGLVDTLEETEAFEEMLALVVEFLNKRPDDAFSAKFITIWAARLFEEERLPEVIEQCQRWLEMHNNPVFKDGLYYWSGMAHLQLSQYPQAIASFEKLLSEFPFSAYTPDATLRKGICHYYEQAVEPARETLTAYTERYPDGDSIDQAYYFLGEVESLAGYLELAINYFTKADELTTSQDVHDGVAFRIGELYESLKQYQKMLDHFVAYTERFDIEGQLTEALLQIGRAYELLNQPTEMLALYRKSITRFANDPKNFGVDALIEAYTEKYDSNLRQLKRTVEFLDQIRDDLEFRKLMVSDRGALFEEFYNNPDIIQDLYNDLRINPAFNLDLMEDLSPIEPIGIIYHEQLNKYPKDTPETYFRQQLINYQSEDQPIAEARMLMGLYRNDIALDPATPYEESFLDAASPRLILYVADYFREKDIDRSVVAWNKLLERFPSDDAAIVAYIRLADYHETGGRIEEALQNLDAAASAFPWSPKFPMITLRQGELLTRLGRTEEAREKYQYILRIPDWRGILHARALFQTGQAFMADEDYPAAHGFFERTFLGYSHFTDWCARAYLADAEALVEMGDPESARATLDEAIIELKESTTEELYNALIEKRANI